MLRGKFHSALVRGLVLVLVSASCSVSTPRNGELGVSADREASSAAGTDPAQEAGTSIAPVTGERIEVDESSTATGGDAVGDTPDAAVGGGTGPAAAPAPGSPQARTASETGVTNDKIRISVIAGFSGPLAAVVETAFDGLDTWADDLNAAGGVHGRRVEMVRVDHKETADGGIAACKEAISNDTLFAAVLEGIEANLTAVSCLDAAGVPTLYYSATTDPAWKLGFSDVVTSAAGGEILASFTTTQLEGTTRKVGVMYVNQLAYKATADTFVPAAEARGVDVVSTEAVEPNQASFTPQLLRMRNAGVEILVVSATAEAIGIVRDARSIGWNPTITGWGFTFDFITAAAADLFKDVTAIRVNAAVDSAAYTAYEARMKANGRSRDRSADLEGFLAYGHGLLMTEMLTAAGVNPTRASLVSGTETITDYDNGILPPVKFGPGRHEGATAAFPVICCNSDNTWKGLGPARAEF